MGVDDRICEERCLTAKPQTGKKVNVVALIIDGKSNK
jgi:hypothetical protein